MSKRTLIFAAVILTALVGLIVALGNTGDDRGSTEPAVVKVPVDGLDADRKPDDKTLTVPKVAVDQAADALSGDVPASVPLDPEDADHTGQVDETPAGASSQALRENARALDRNRRATTALPTAGASGGAPGCVTSFVRNQSGRRGVRPIVQVWHYTVSANRPGRSDVNGIVAFFNRSSSQASSHFVIDAEGNCAYIVPIEAKAWTQAGGNPWAVSYEIIATGKERAYLAPAGYAKLAKVMRWVSARTGIPMRRGRIGGCAPSRSGIVQHRDGGTCWGGHHDIGPFPFATALAQVTKGARPVTRANRMTCGKINAWRKAGRPKGGDWERNSRTRIANLRKRGVACTSKGARRA